MDRFADTCGWTRPESKGARYCKLKKTFLTEADRGIGICPCISWIQRLEKPKKAAIPPKSLF